MLTVRLKRQIKFSLWFGALSVVTMVSFNNCSGSHSTNSALSAIAAKRLKIILEIAPEMANHYRNLAGITYLQGKPEEASKYLQEYLDQYPLADPKKRAHAKVQIETWQKKEQENQ